MVGLWTFVLSKFVGVCSKRPAGIHRLPMIKVTE
jgi:hypothetical protein